MTLTAKQEAFCVQYVKLGNASEAYRVVYDASNMKPDTVNRAAKQLLDNPKIATRLSEIRGPAVVAAQLTLKEHLDDLRRLRNAAEQDLKWGAAITAEVARGKASGLYVERQEVSSTVNLKGDVTIAPADAYKLLIG